MFDLVPISLTGFNKLKEELNRLEKEAAEVRIRVSEAREQGDLSENGEFIYGRQQLGFLNGRLGELRTQINHSEKIDCTKVKCDRAVFGTIVTLLNLETQEKVTYQLLGPNDADIDTGSISILSPVGDAIHGLSVGEKASVKIPKGEFHFEVIEIARSQIE
ncbi:MAG: transcription elongation factor GreA [Alphaproteobacteria bacterium]|nr:MAG: transcription elongation factor GreA [Alphaproteobacteria bacterium]